MAAYRIRLVGGSAQLGEVEAADVARLVLGVERTVARAAGVSIGRPVKPTGRRATLIKRASNFRLIDVSHGSVTIDLTLPEPDMDDQLGFELQSLGDRGWDLAVAAVAGDMHADFQVLKSWADLADQLNVGTKYDAVEIGRVQENKPARLDARRRAQLHRAVHEKQRQGASGLTGLLVEADFERNTAHVRTSDGPLVEVVFDAEQADDIQEALRQQSAFRGEVVFDPVTNGVKSIRLRQLIRTEQLMLGPEEAGAFWRQAPFAELQASEGASVVESFDDLHDDSLTDEEFDEFLAALH